MTRLFYWGNLECCHGRSPLQRRCLWPKTKDWVTYSRRLGADGNTIACAMRRFYGSQKTAVKVPEDAQRGAMNSRASSARCLECGLCSRRWADLVLCGPS